MNNKTKTKWSASVATLTVVSWMMGYILLTGCASKKELYQHQGHNIQCDTLSAKSKAEQRKHQKTVNLDSLVTAKMWQAMKDFVAEQQERETTTEHVEQTQHADGSVTTTTDRRTDRTLNRQEQRHEEQSNHDYQLLLQREISRYDSIWRMQLQQYQAHLRDSLNEAVNMKKEPANSAPWYILWWERLKTLIVIAIIIIFFWFTRSLWQPLFNK